MNYSLENDNLKIDFRIQGGEITSITNKNDNKLKKCKEYIKK